MKLDCLESVDRFFLNHRTCMLSLVHLNIHEKKELDSVDENEAFGNNW